MYVEDPASSPVTEESPVHLYGVGGRGGEDPWLFWVFSVVRSPKCELVFFRLLGGGFGVHVTMIWGLSFSFKLVVLVLCSLSRFHYVTASHVAVRLAYVSTVFCTSTCLFCVFYVSRGIRCGVRKDFGVLSFCCWFFVGMFLASEFVVRSSVWAPVWRLLMDLSRALFGSDSVRLSS